MKKVLLLIPFLGLFFLISCRQESVLFTEPQPLKGKEILLLPESYFGSYSNSDEDLMLIIKEIGAYLYQTTELPVLKAEFDTCSSCIFEGDSVFIAEDNFKGSYRIEGDSVFVNFTEVDTFELANENIVFKKFKNNYYLSELINDSLWRVDKIFLKHKDTIAIASMSKEKELDLIREIMPVKEINDSTGLTKKYVLNPTKKQFKEIIKANTFTDVILFGRE